MKHLLKLNKKWMALLLVLTMFISMTGIPVLACDYYHVTYNANGATSGSVPTDTHNYEHEDDVVVKGNTGSLGKTGYNFTGWTKKSDGTGTVYVAGNTFEMGKDDVILYAKWAPRTDISYVVNYLKQGTNAVLAPQKAVGGKTFGTDATEVAIAITGYNKVDPTSVTITLAASGNAITFFYTARTDISYVVNYLEQGTNAVLAPQKSVSGKTFGTDATEAAIAISGYTEVAPTSVTITLAASGNTITFFYIKLIAMPAEVLPLAQPAPVPTVIPTVTPVVLPNETVPLADTGEGSNGTVLAGAAFLAIGIAGVVLFMNRRKEEEASE